MAAPAPTPASFRTVLRLGLVFDSLDDMVEPPGKGVRDNCHGCSLKKMASLFISNGCLVSCIGEYERVQVLDEPTRRRGAMASAGVDVAPMRNGSGRSTSAARGSPSAPRASRLTGYTGTGVFLAHAYSTCCKGNAAHLCLGAV
jgi:hypothetical protein